MELPELSCRKTPVDAIPRKWNGLVGSTAVLPSLRIILMEVKGPPREGSICNC